MREKGKRVEDCIILQITDNEYYESVCRDNR